MNKKEIPSEYKCSRCKKDLRGKCECSIAHPSSLNGLSYKTPVKPDYDLVLDDDNLNYLKINLNILNGFI